MIKQSKISISWVKTHLLKELKYVLVEYDDTTLNRFYVIFRSTPQKRKAYYQLLKHFPGVTIVECFDSIDKGTRTVIFDLDANQIKKK